MLHIVIIVHYHILICRELSNLKYTYTFLILCYNFFQITLVITLLWLMQFLDLFLRLADIQFQLLLDDLLHSL